MELLNDYWLRTFVCLETIELDFTEGYKGIVESGSGHSNPVCGVRSPS